MQISQNIPALRTHLNLSRANRRLAAASIKLSSGYRINSAKDDPTGLAISNKLSLQLSGISKATENASNGVALIQTAEGALTEVHNMLQRMRELAVQAANDTNTADDREKMQTEIEGLVEEIESIAKNTEYNRIKILNGEGSRVSESYVRGNATKDVHIASVAYISEDVQPGKLEYTIDQVGTPAVHEILSATDKSVFNGIPDDAIITINGIHVRRGDANSFEEFETMLAETLDYAGIELKTVFTDPDDPDDPADAVASTRYLVTSVAGSAQEISIMGNADLLKSMGLVATDGLVPGTGDGTPYPAKYYGGAVKGTDAVITNLELFDANDPPSSLANESNGLTYYSNGNQITVKGINGEEIRINLMVETVFDSTAALPGVNGAPVCRFLDDAETTAAVINENDERTHISIT